MQAEPRHRRCGLAGNRHVGGISAECRDVLLPPLSAAIWSCRPMLEEGSPFALISFVISGRHESKCAQTRLADDRYGILQVRDAF